MSAFHAPRVEVGVVMIQVVDTAPVADRTFNAIPSV